MYILGAILIFLLSFFVGWLGWTPIAATLLGEEVAVSQVLVGVFLVVCSIYLARLSYMVWDSR